MCDSCKETNNTKMNPEQSKKGIVKFIIWSLSVLRKIFTKH